MRDISELRRRIAADAKLKFFCGEETIQEVLALDDDQLNKLADRAVAGSGEPPVVNG